ncbi:Protein of unknown function (DUF2457) [Geosmithia morbida]|uniref:Uncharacterized protein n=1 Tax=Geosmithia morbida TaxID=1094350 RepID=A0A9P5D0B1_9HYPO|nr:Protein of unknown function (DUF2457) [Geosmithia morbida]KAF4119266.1 Protein of unknown function (DUF2457) [Geosmithia morbida]
MSPSTPIAWQVPVWAAQDAEETDEVDDEPPEAPPHASSPQKFTRTAVRRPSEQTSLLTKAIMGYPDQVQVHLSAPRDEFPSAFHTARRRSMASNVSLASTADLTSDTGMTSPARTNTPSPPIPESVVSRLSGVRIQSEKTGSVTSYPASARTGTSLQRSPELQQKAADAPRKRSIQFTCTGKPAAAAEKPAARLPAVASPRTNVQLPQPQPQPPQPAARRPCIKFACPARPASTQNTPPAARPTTPRSSSRTPRKPESPSTPRRYSAVAVGSANPGSPSVARRSSSRPPLSRPKFLRANSNDLVLDGSQFHEFARERSREDDWIRQDSVAAKGKLTIDDTLVKENRIRRLGREAEEEAELEEDDDDDNIEDEDDDVDNQDDNDNDEEDEEDEDEDDEDEDENEDDLDDALSDGYHTDEETGFAESDESDGGEDDNLVLWTLSKSPAAAAAAAAAAAKTAASGEATADGATTTGLGRQPFLRDQQPHSDSSTMTAADSSRRRSNMQRIKPQPEAPDLPDSTDFVCGTLDEDRPLEEAYLTCMAARRNEKLRIIPQDIDPSFPASDPEDDEDEDIYNPVHHDSDDDDFFPGKMEDLHHEQDHHRSTRRRRKSGLVSPTSRKYYHSPAPNKQLRERSPRGSAVAISTVEAEQQQQQQQQQRKPTPPPPAPSRRARSPPPPTKTKQAGKQGGAALLPKKSPRPTKLGFNLAVPAPHAGLTATKSLPRAGVTFGQGGKQHSRGTRRVQKDDVHLRGAIDIVKGLEKKRQRRREKFYQKYCNRARRGQIPERKTQPGRGAERMKELGLLMAGKKDQGNYVMSI